MTDGIFDERVAATYDERHAPAYDPDLLSATVAVLAELAGGGPALEFASGTGRVALPLHRAGVEVNGIELSQAMTERLRAKPGGDRVPVTIGDMATTRVDGSFRLVYLVFNTIGNLLTQDEQVRCFQNAADHLDPGGVFVVELLVPPIGQLRPGQTAALFTNDDRHVGFDEYDLVTQRLVSNHLWIDGDRVDRVRVPQRWVWPSELDLMARLAGLRLRHRWAGWDRSPFTARSTSHVSVWEKG